MKNALTGIVAALFVVGCASEIPSARTHDLTSQKKIKAAHHWDVIAADVASETKKALAETGQRRVYVTATGSKSAFDQAFHNFLITQLVRQGVSVGEKPGDALEVRYETQLIRHPSQRVEPIPGGLTALAAGLLVLHNVPKWSQAQQGGVGLASIAGFDYLTADRTSVTQTELVVTTSMLDAGQYRMRKSDVYYIEDADGALFQQAKEWKVVGS